MLELVVYTPTKQLVHERVNAVYFPSENGVLGVLPDHVPLVTMVGAGVCHFSMGNMDGFVSISGGIAQITHNKVTLLTDVAEEAASIDVARAQKALERASNRLAGKESYEVDVERALHARRRATARIEAAAVYATRKNR